MCLTCLCQRNNHLFKFKSTLLRSPQHYKLNKPRQYSQSAACWMPYWLTPLGDPNASLAAEAAHSDLSFAGNLVVCLITRQCGTVLDFFRSCLLLYHLLTIYIYSTNMYILNGYHMSIKWKCLNMCAYVSPNQKSHMMLESAPCLWEPGKLSCREACCLDTCFSRRGTLPTPHLHSPLALRDKLQHLGFGRITVAVTEMGSMDKERTDSLNAVPHELQCCHDT